MYLCIHIQIQSTQPHTALNNSPFSRGCDLLNAKVLPTLINKSKPIIELAFKCWAIVVVFCVLGPFSQKEYKISQCKSWFSVIEYIFTFSTTKLINKANVHQEK